LKQVSLACKSFVTAKNFYPMMHRQYDGTLLSANWGWPVELLPHLDNSTIYDAISESGALPTSDGGVSAALSKPGLSLKMLVCPEDFKYGDDGALSYAANMGYVPAQIWGNPNLGTNGPLPNNVSNTNLQSQIDWLGLGNGSLNDNVKITRDTGVFMTPLETTYVNPQNEVRISSGDGLGNTLMFGENLQVDNWASPLHGMTGFALGMTTTSGPPYAPVRTVDGPGAIGVGTAENTALVLLNTDNGAANNFKLYDLATASPDNRINRNLDAPVGTKWRLSSNHSGFVIVAFCDGGCKSLNDSIDDRVFARLITPVGTKRYGQLLDSDTSREAETP